ncbi:scarecrow-like protein 18, partial [Tanacetum coccineum]
MLSSSSINSHHNQEQNQDQEVDLHPDLLIFPPPPSPSIYFRQLLLSCAHSISHSDFTAAHRITTSLSANSSPYGDSSERLIHSFTKAINLRLNPHPNLAINSNPGTNDDLILQSSYLSLNQVTPFVRFTQLTANQAILEAIDHDQTNDIHILDFDIMHGVQWPPLMQAIADRDPPPSLRITATGTDLETLRRTGDRLSMFAHSLGL